MKHPIPKDTKMKNENFQDDVFNFLDMSQKILALLKHESAILASSGCLSIENYLSQRSSLLQRYEMLAASLVESEEIEQRNSDMTAMLLTELVAVRDALSDNTALQFRTLEKNILESKGDSSWH